MKRTNLVVMEFEREIGRPMTADERGWFEQQGPFIRAQFADALSAFTQAVGAQVHRDAASVGHSLEELGRRLHR